MSILSKQTKLRRWAELTTLVKTREKNKTMWRRFGYENVKIRTGFEKIWYRIHFLYLSINRKLKFYFVFMIEFEPCSSCQKILSNVIGSAWRHTLRNPLSALSSFTTTSFHVTDSKLAHSPIPNWLIICFYRMSLTVFSSGCSIKQNNTFRYLVYLKQKENPDFLLHVEVATQRHWN